MSITHPPVIGVGQPEQAPRRGSRRERRISLLWRRSRRATLHAVNVDHGAPYL
jgi:hypothetical protein